MTEATDTSAAAGPSYRCVEIGVALATAAFGLVVIVGSLRAGIGWGAEGPKSGFFPFYIGVIIVGASLVNLSRAPFEHVPGSIFAAWSQLRQVMAVVIPTAVYVAAIPWSGIYVASFALIAVFMTWLGRYRAPFSLAIAFCVVAAIYLTFEKWFLVPLPKGPIEDLLGL